MDFLPYMKAVGTGKKRNRDLTSSEMKLVMRAILEGEIYPEQISAFLLGWRIKGESLEEFSGALEVFDEYITPLPLPNSIEFGYPYDGKVDNPYLIFLTAKYLSDFDLQIALHGDLWQPSKAGTTLKEIATALTLPENVHFYDRADFFPALHRLTLVRQRLGIRTSLNTLEKLPGITHSKIAIIGAFHKPFIDKYATLFKDRYETLAIIKGNEGTPEIFSKCSVIIIRQGEAEEIKIDPQDFGIEDIRSKERITPQHSISQIQNPSQSLLKLAKLNAAVIAYIAGKTKNIEETYRLLNEA